MDFGRLLPDVKTWTLPISLMPVDLATEPEDVLDTLNTPSVLQSAVGVQLAYESLIQFLRRPSNQDWIVAELSGVEIHHYNFLDVFFELHIFGRFTNGSAPEPFEGGFLERLFALISMWEVDEWELATGLYFTVLIDHLTALCEVLFSQPLELYDGPAALARTVLCLLRQLIQLMDSQFGEALSNDIP